MTELADVEATTARCPTVLDPGTFARYKEILTMNPIDDRHVLQECPRCETPLSDPNPSMCPNCLLCISCL